MSDENPPISSEGSGVSRPDARTYRAVRLAAIITAWLAGVGALAIPTVENLDLRYISIFYEQYAKIEIPWLSVVALFAVATLVALRRPPPNSFDTDVMRRSRFDAHPVAWTVAVALGVLVVTLVGTDLVFHRFLLSDDEYSAWFAAVMMSHGQATAPVPAEWCHWIANLTPTTITTPQACTWKLTFLPIHSAIRGAFIALGIDRFAGPVMAAASILLVGNIARKLWPGHPHRAWIAIGVLAVSTQFLVMSMTMYAMPTHLLFSLIWLRLYIEDRRWSVLLLPWIGVLAMGVHSPTPHILLVPPFLFRYVRQKRWATVAYVGAVYAVGLVFWHTQLTTTGSLGADAVGVAAASRTATTIGALFHLPSLMDLYTSAMNLTLIATWNAPVAVICLIAACMAWDRLDAFSRDAAVSLLLMIVVRAISTPMQGEGWGYRYVYAGLGLMALLAARGWEVLAAAVGRRRASALMWSSLLVTLAVQLPIRGAQVESIIRPYYLSYEYLSHLPARVVILPAGEFMWGRQLVRNDPFFRSSPLIMDMVVYPEVSADQCPARKPTEGSGMSINKLCLMLQQAMGHWPGTELMAKYPGQVHVVKPAELAQFGLAQTKMHILPLMIVPEGESGMLPRPR